MMTLVESRTRRSNLVLAVTVMLPLAVFARIGDADAASPEAIPRLADYPALTVEAGMPASVQARAVRAQREAIAFLRKAENHPRSRSAGCTESDYPGSLGPAAPRVTARLFGRHVEVVVRFDRWPRSLACRPWAIRASVTGKPASPQTPRLPWTQTFVLRGRPVGRTVLFRLPAGATAPYELSVSAQTLDGSPSKHVRMRLRCPSGGCLRGDTYRNGKLVPQPAFRLRGVDRGALRGSVHAALVPAVPAPFTMSAVHCPKLTICEATFVDPLFADMPYRVRFEIEGEQLAGCWTARIERQILDPLPYEGAFTGGIPPAGCVSWLR